MNVFHITYNKLALRCIKDAHPRSLTHNIFWLDTIQALGNRFAIATAIWYLVRAPILKISGQCQLGAGYLDYTDKIPIPVLPHQKHSSLGLRSYNIFARAADTAQAPGTAWQLPPRSRVSSERRFRRKPFGLWPWKRF